MRKILLFIAASFVFLSAMAQITQYESDSIVLQRMSTETRQYTLFAQKNLYIYNELSFRTSVGEILELNCSCWVYYIRYVEETNKHDCRYLIVNDSNGNLLEVKTRNDLIPDDLDSWRTVEWVAIPFTEYPLDSLSCQWTNIASDTVIMINSNEELENYITCAGNNYPAIDFSQYSLLFVHGNTVYGSIAHLIINGVALLSPDNYKLNIEIQLQDTAASQPWHVAIVVPKMGHNTTVHLNLYYPHISVWKFVYPIRFCGDVTIILTMDTLLGTYYTNISPQNYRDCGTIFQFGDSVDGKYFIEEDTICFYDCAYDHSNKFIRTIFSPDIIFLHYTGVSHEGILDYYYFIRQNFKH
jgi:hypothetical protein